uniref:Major facilitator superfamily (MFS) profile domain-containing protein n=1 Tax=Plectus sambesii TaxID=2011161 RepID=A0A914X3C3_9BILA
MACSSNASLVSHTPDPEDMEADQKYGWGRFKPSCLQRLHGAKFLLVCISFCGVTQGMLINGLIPVSLSSLERRFSLGSFQSGLLVSAYDVAVLLCLVPCTHFGGSGHKGRWLGIGMLIMALGSFVFVLPQVLSGPYSGYKANDTSHALCGADVDASVANTSFESNALYYALLLIGNFLHGVGATPLFTLGVTFLDESVTHEMSPLYLGIFMGSALFGPVLGFGGGGALLRANGDWLKQDPPANISPDDPQWYGAWWLGFLLGGLMALVSGVLMLGFARRLPDAPEQKVEVTTHMKIATSKEQFVTGVK